MSNPTSLPTKGTTGRRLILRGLGPTGSAPASVHPKSLPVRGFGDRRALLRGMGPMGQGVLKSSVVIRGYGSKRVISKGFESAASHGKFPLPILLTTDVLGL